MEITYDFEKGTVTLPIATYVKLLANDIPVQPDMKSDDLWYDNPFWTMNDELSTQAFNLSYNT